VGAVGGHGRSVPVPRRSRTPWSAWGLEAYAARGSTFGIPLLHPWANRLGGFTYRAAGVDVALDGGGSGVRTEEHGLPIHGLVAAYRGWRVLEVGADTLTAELAFDEDPALLAAFPFRHRLRLDIALTPQRLTVTTTLTPTSQQPVPVAFGFHPYFTVPGAAREDVVLRLPAMTRARRSTARSATRPTTTTSPTSASGPRSRSAPGAAS
jgi:aldose 1-epimerase